MILCYSCNRPKKTQGAAQTRFEDYSIHKGEILLKGKVVNSVTWIYIKGLRSGSANILP